MTTQRSDRVDGLAAHLTRPLGPTADRAVGAFTDLGSVYGLAGTAAVLAATGRRRAAVDVLGAGGTAWVVAQAAKPLVERPRPYQDLQAARLVAEPAGSSWPSGHTAVAAAMATVVSGQARSRTAGALAGTVLTGFVGTSRVYVGVHHPTDVVAGAGVGVLSAGAWNAVRRLVTRSR